MRLKAVLSLVLAAALVILLALSAPGAVLGQPAQDGALPTATAQPGGGVTVTSKVELDLSVNGDGIEAAFLAPDGEHFARLNRIEREACFYRIDGVQEACYPFPENVQPYLDSVHLSPDGARLVFADGQLSADREDTDIWVLDAASGQYANLTDDGYTGRVVREPANANLDYSPVLSADGSQVAFLRIVQRQDDLGPITLTTIPAAGGDATAQRELAAFDGFRVTDIAWGPDNASLAYFYDARNEEDSALGGVWWLRLDDPNPQHVLPVEDDVSLINMAFSPDGAYLLVTLRNSNADLRAPEDFPAWIVPLSGGEPVPVDAEHVVFAAAWRVGSGSPMLAYAVYRQSGDEANGLYFTTNPGQPGVLGLAGGYLGPADVGRRMTWAGNGVLLVSPLLEPLVVVHTDGE